MQIINRDAMCVCVCVWSPGSGTQNRVSSDLAAGQRMIALYRLFLPRCLTAEQIPFDRQRFIGLGSDDERPPVYYPVSDLHGTNKAMETRRHG